MRYQNVGLQVYDKARATPGYTLISRLRGCGAYLLGMDGEVVHEWNTPHPPGDLIQLLPNTHNGLPTKPQEITDHVNRITFNEPLEQGQITIPADSDDPLAMGARKLS